MLFPSISGMWAHMYPLRLHGKDLPKKNILRSSLQHALGRESAGKSGGSGELPAVSPARSSPPRNLSLATAIRRHHRFSRRLRRARKTRLQPSVDLSTFDVNPSLGGPDRPGCPIRHRSIRRRGGVAMSGVTAARTPPCTPPCGLFDSRLPPRITRTHLAAPRKPERSRAPPTARNTDRARGARSGPLWPSAPACGTARFPRSQLPPRAAAGKRTSPSRPAAAQFYFSQGSPSRIAFPSDLAVAERSRPIFYCSLTTSAAAPQSTAPVPVDRSPEDSRPHKAYNAAPVTGRRPSGPLPAVLAIKSRPLPKELLRRHRSTLSPNCPRRSPVTPSVRDNTSSSVSCPTVGVFV
ncbi:hypothetical protein VUR80DRAFT_7263 [Thermomyces stellatus]